jgi:hypothetical protein
MAWFSNLFGRRGTTTTVMTTIGQPFRVYQPIIGFLNLLGPKGGMLLEADRSVLSPLFTTSRVSSSAVPRAHVLFVYCDITADGSVVGGGGARLRDLIKSAGAYVAIVASENTGSHYANSAPRREDWHANIVFTLHRKGDKFSSFFKRLFTAMFNDTSMLMAWVKLAPQGPGPWMDDFPETYMTIDAGHIVFDSHSPADAAGDHNAGYGKEP